MTNTRKLHDLMLSFSDAEALSTMLEAHRRGASSEADPAVALAEVLSQARRVPDDRLPPDRVALGSSVTYFDEPTGARRTVRVVLPQEADLSLGKISVLSPIGRALIGRRRGDVVDAQLPGGRLVELHVLAIEPVRDALNEA